MGYLVVGSSNPQLSYILQKNPNSIWESKKPYEKSIRKGMAYGFFGNQDQAFMLWFKDPHGVMSFGYSFAQEDFEYLDTTRYAHPYLPVCLISECLASALKQGSELDVPQESGFAYAQTQILVKSQKTLDALKAHFNREDVKVIDRPLTSQASILTVQAPTVQHALNLMTVVCLLQTLSDRDFAMDLKIPVLEKYIRCLNKVQAPYFARYLFQTRTIHDPSTFQKVRSELEVPGVIMNYGDTRKQRFDAIRKILSGGESLIDIGANGELYYAMALSRKYKSVLAIDKDEDEVRRGQGRILHKQLSESVSMAQAEVDSQWVEENAELFVGADVLLTEVVEHMPLDVALNLIRAILKTDYHTLVVTTPNKAFNKHYLIPDEQMRHEDHVWEQSKAVFEQCVQELVQNTDSAVTVTGIGDSIDGEYTSSLAIFEKTT